MITMQLCACGCGGFTVKSQHYKGYNKYIKYHYIKNNNPMDKPEVRIKHSESMQKQEYKDKQSRISKERWENENYKVATLAKIATTLKKPEVGKKISIILSERSSFKRPEVRAKSQATRNKPENRVRHTDTMKKIWQNPNSIYNTIEYRNKLSEANLGEKSYNWRGGISFLPYPIEFNSKLKRNIRKRDNYTCQRCEMTEEEHKDKWHRALAINHIDYNKNNCNPNNLITLCNPCNAKVNTTRDYWTDFFSKLLEEKNIKDDIYETREENRTKRPKQAVA